MRHERSHAKVIATLGPATDNRATLEKMFHEGIDVVRLNFSHGDHDTQRKRIEMVLAMNKELKSNVALLADLQGPKLRVGVIENNFAELEAGEQFVFTVNECVGNEKRAFISYDSLPKDVQKGDIILVDDGKLQFKVLETDEKENVVTEIVVGGPLSSKKGVNLPNTAVSKPSLTEKDIADARFALDHDVDWIALSFVRKASDIHDLKEIINETGKHAGIIAKIEKPEALDELDDIIDASDAVMVARGDLGVEVAFDKVPLIQKSIVNKCISLSKPVIIATQMMESMITNASPTRAEANDVANAVLDGADTVMLSGETSVGKYPVETIRNMQKIIDSTEYRGAHFFRKHPPEIHNETFLQDSVCYNAVVLAEQSEASAIICLTNSGYTAYRISSHRPRAKVFSFTMNDRLLRRMSLVWGVRAFHFEDCHNINDYIEYTLDFLVSYNLIKKNDLVVHVGSIPIIKKGKTNMIKLSVVQ
ncbi:MAG TPA: pyruvate kinase [Bacteroidales bacterium]|nr:pyruvate kinase [Bacteroidales bacterium]